MAVLCKVVFRVGFTAWTLHKNLTCVLKSGTSLVKFQLKKLHKFLAYGLGRPQFPSQIKCCVNIWHKLFPSSQIHNGKGAHFLSFSVAVGARNLKLCDEVTGYCLVAGYS